MTAGVRGRFRRSVRLGRSLLLFLLFLEHTAPCGDGKGTGGWAVSKNGFVGRAPNNSKMTTPLREGWHAPSFSSASNARPQTGFDIFLSLSVDSARLFGVSLAQRACSVCSVAAENADWIPREKIKGPKLLRNRRFTSQLSPTGFALIRVGIFVVPLLSRGLFSNLNEPPWRQRGPDERGCRRWLGGSLWPKIGRR